MATIVNVLSSPPDGSPLPVDIVVIQPAGYLHSAAFAEVAEILLHGLRALSCDATVQANLIRPGVPAIVLGVHLLPPAEALRLPAGTIIYNLEQIRPGAWAAHAGYLELLSHYTVWDFDAANIEAIKRATVHRRVRHVPIGFVPQLTRIAAAPAPDIDVLFYGSMTPRREAVFQALAAAGMRVHVAFGVYGTERDALIARARVVLCVHAYPDWGFEIVRIAWLLANRKAVVCEANAASDVDADLRNGVLGVPYTRLVDACRLLVQDDAARHRLEQAGWAAFSARDEASILRDALTVPYL